MTNSEYDDYVRQRTSKSRKAYEVRYREPCMPISMLGSKDQDEFYDMRFCGKRGSSPFATAVRPKPSGKMTSKGEETYECPKNFVPCSAATSKGNTVCIQSTKDKSKTCPITLMKFISKADELTYKNDSDYKVEEVNDDYSFIWSKTKGDNLPLTTFKVEGKPCLDPHDTSLAPGQQFYPLERDRLLHDCSIVEQYGERHDKRFTDMGLTISEYDVQKESKVLKKLEDLPNFSLYTSETAKKNYRYTFWSRSTISWKLSCDDKHPRSSVLKAANFEKDKSEMHEGVIIGLLSIAFGIGAAGAFGTTVFFCAGCLKKRDCGKGGLRVLSTICLSIQLVFIIVSFFLMQSQKGELAERKKAMEDLAFVNGCGDDYMNIPTSFVPTIEQASSTSSFALLLCIVQAILTFGLCITCAACGKSKDDDDDSDEEYDLHKEEDEERQAINSE
uniref:Uncharacterized protein n=1 Tax=Favella ehrenbergii TaxID=182087 RepID=A0A7S3MKJ6_9SPIT|mmetsp:Transcript_17362/g.21903  ORF Transcript_17362/g.21903 Transcript_17362/m.21903 type:complete len:445 (+) Transcript_17362:330-1664(+)|eukprot:CAMPEP_0170467098 /NCGR_PEP_ID=MMETSP0123-20130129/10803_1 /TAXON_ID=182087 /ORGANISM="Favella ehrenbergii, Strain Fehren 1" /LENGTH=444 /DNA_ID=CAMNT_0010733377 /DNA_START=330 /DNA_END=1664 /DNA_ORIENTATION=-